MYLQEDLAQVNRRLRRTWFITAAIAAVFIAGYVFTLIRRQFWPGYALLLAGVLTVILSLYEVIGPQRAYRRHLTRALSGQGIVLAGTVSRVETAESSHRMGRDFYSLYFRPDEAGEERKLYIEARFAASFPPEKHCWLRVQEHYVINQSETELK